jgi:thioesterase domain-containing protein
MRAVQPEGPYYLIAMCGGCQIAEQMILQLEAQQQTVGLFTIFDTWVLEHAHRRWGFRLFGYQQRFQWLRKATFREKVGWVKSATINRVRDFTGTAKIAKPWAEAYWPENFTPPRFRAPIVLFKRPKQLYFYVNDPLLGWGARTEGGVQVHEVHANHHEILREPHVQWISEVLVARIDRIATREAPPASAVSEQVASDVVVTSH